MDVFNFSYPLTKSEKIIDFSTFFIYKIVTMLTFIVNNSFVFTLSLFNYLIKTIDNHFLIQNGYCLIDNFYLFAIPILNASYSITITIHNISPYRESV